MLEVELSEDWSAERLAEAMAPQTPPGLTIMHVEVMSEGTGKAQAAQVEFTVRVPAERSESAAARIAAFLSETGHSIQREGAAPRWICGRW